METTFNQSIAADYSRPNAYIITRFINWCRDQQEHRLLWLGLALAGHGCFFTPLTMVAVMASGNHLSLYIMAIATMGMVLVTNLAAMPTKITIPVFMFSLVLDLGIIITCALNGFNFMVLA